MKTQQTTEKRDRLAELDEMGEFPPMWNPQVGESIRGTVRRYTQVDLEKSGLTWLCVVEKEDGEPETIFLSSTVLKSEFKRQRPAIGETIFVRYLGTPPNKAYKKYVLRVCDRDEMLEPDWESFDEPYNFDRNYSAKELKQTGNPTPAAPVNKASQGGEPKKDPFLDEMAGSTPYSSEVMTL